MRDDLTVRRRQILAGLALAATAPLPAFAAAAPSLQAWVHERKPGPAGGLVLGALFVRDPAGLAAALTDARRRTGFTGALRYASTNRFQRDYARAALGALLADGSWRYAALAASWPSDPDQQRARYYDAYLRLLGADARDGLTLHKRPNRTVGPEAALDRHLALKLPTLRPAPYLARDDIAQLAGFITGAVAARAQPPANPVKAELIGRVTASGRFSLTVI